MVNEQSADVPPVPTSSDRAASSARAGLLRARAGLLRAFEPPDTAVVEYVAQLGAVAAWRAVRDRRAPRAVLAPTAARTENRSAEELDEQADADLAAAAAAGARLIGPGDAEWPEAALLSLVLATGRGVKHAAPPVALYVRGASLARLPRWGVSVVGSRANTAYGQRVAADIAMGAAEAGMTVVSGAAFGIDTVAHRAALAYPGTLPTVAVLACGIDRAYPVANTGLIDRIAAVGSVVSEYPPGASPARHRFLVRNRLIAALSAGTVVVEAGRRSGTLSTAGAARMLGRVVMAVPGPVTSALSVGCHLLLSSDAALLVTGADDVLALVDPRRLHPGGGNRAVGAARAGRQSSSHRWPGPGGRPGVRSTAVPRHQVAERAVGGIRTAGSDGDGRTRCAGAARPGPAAERRLASHPEVRPELSTSTARAARRGTACEAA